MKSIEELRETPHLVVEGRVAVGCATYESEVYNGWIDLGGGKFKGTVLFGYKEAGWEHVSVSHFNKHKLPTWEDMCLIKEMFWGKDVTVCQFHPAEEAYVHDIGVPGAKLENVLHLWRPIDGDWSVITEEMMKYL